MRTGYQTVTCNPMFSAALFIISKIHKLSISQQMNGWGREAAYINILYTDAHTQLTFKQCEDLEALMH